ncbi:MAG: Esterase TesA [Planctomycetota bacterium]|jgi:acyl-CoA thioesterase-1
MRLLAAILLVMPMSAADLVCLGDSLTAGFGVDPEQAWPVLLQGRLAAAATTAGWRVVNAGVSGDTTAGGLRRIDRLLVAKPAAVLVCLGGNDGLRGLPAEAMQANLDRVLARIRAAGARPFVAGIEVPTSFPEEDRAAFSAVFPAVATAHQAPLLPSLLTGVAMVPELNQADRIHPNPEGHRVIAARVHAWIAPQLAP